MFNKNLVYAKSQTWLTSRAVTTVTLQEVSGSRHLWFPSSKIDNSQFYFIFYLLNSPDSLLVEESAILPAFSPSISISMFWVSTFSWSIGEGLTLGLLVFHLTSIRSTIQFVLSATLTASLNFFFCKRISTSSWDYKQSLLVCYCIFLGLLRFPSHILVGY